MRYLVKLAVAVVIAAGALVLGSGAANAVIRFEELIRVDVDVNAHVNLGGLLGG